MLAGSRRYHRYFDDLLLLLDSQQPEACGMLGRCGLQYVVEADSSMYPCDFYILHIYRLGNLNTDTFAQPDERRTALGFIEASAGVPVVWALPGRLPPGQRTKLQQRGKNHHREVYQSFFACAWPRLEKE